MSNPLYVSLMHNLHLMYGKMKKTLEPLKFLDLNCPENSLMLNKIQNEINEIDQIIGNFLLNDTVKRFKDCEDIEQDIIHKMFAKLYTDLRVPSYKIVDLIEEEINKNSVP